MRKDIAKVVDEVAAVLALCELGKGGSTELEVGGGQLLLVGMSSMGDGE